MTLRRRNIQLPFIGYTTPSTRGSAGRRRIPYVKWREVANSNNFFAPGIPEHSRCFREQKSGIPGEGHNAGRARVHEAHHLHVQQPPREISRRRSSVNEPTTRGRYASRIGPSSYESRVSRYPAARRNGRPINARSAPMLRRMSAVPPGAGGSRRVGALLPYLSGTGGLAVELLPRACIAVGRIVSSGT